MFFQLQSLICSLKFFPAIEERITFSKTYDCLKTTKAEDSGVCLNLVKVQTDKMTNILTEDDFDQVLHSEFVGEGVKDILSFSESNFQSYKSNKKYWKTIFPIIDWKQICIWKKIKPKWLPPSCALI